MCSTARHGLGKVFSKLSEYDEAAENLEATLVLEREVLEREL